MVLCRISAWIGHRYTCVPPILNPSPFPLYPSGLSQSTGFGCPASWMDLVLVICFTYGKLHISMLFSQNIPPLTSPIKKIKQNLPLLTKWVRCSKLHTWKILDEDLKLFISESNRIIFLLPKDLQLQEHVGHCQKYRAPGTLNQNCWIIICIWTIVLGNF